MRQILIFSLHDFFISNTFISNARLKLAKNQAKAKQHPEDELLVFENYSLSLSTLSIKNNRRHSKKCIKTSASALMTFMINDNENETENKE